MVGARTGGPVKASRSFRRNSCISTRITTVDALKEIIAGLEEMRSDLAEFYKDLHRHPELSMQEQRISAKAAERLRTAGYAATTGVGRTGAVGILDNGAGPT